MFFLTNEQIEEIIDIYGGDVELINEIQKDLNMLAIIDNEEDYYDVICNIVSQVETFKLQNEQSIKQNGKTINYKLIDIIEVELNRKYNNFEDFKQETRANVTKHFSINIKIRHN